MVICNYKAELLANDFSITHRYTPDRKNRLCLFQHSLFLFRLVLSAGQYTPTL